MPASTSSSTPTPARRPPRPPGSGARLPEVDVDMRHGPMGRTIAGFAHRAQQGSDVARALWPRLTTTRQRIAAIVAVAIALTGMALWSGAGAEPASIAAPTTYRKV